MCDAGMSIPFFNLSILFPIWISRNSWWYWKPVFQKVVISPMTNSICYNHILHNELSNSDKLQIRQWSQMIIPPGGTVASFWLSTLNVYMARLSNNVIPQNVSWSFSDAWLYLWGFSLFIMFSLMLNKLWAIAIGFPTLTTFVWFLLSVGSQM